MCSDNHQQPQQIPLRYPDTPLYTFENFITGSNMEVVENLRSLPEDSQLLYIHGVSGSGKTHLLNAFVNEYPAHGDNNILIPLEDSKQYGVDMLENLEHYHCICIDNIHQIAGDHCWETALFHLINRIFESSGIVIISGQVPARHLRLNLLDLKSRLCAGLGFRLYELDDSEKIRALQLKAHQLGMSMTTEVGQYLLKYNQRDMHALTRTLKHFAELCLTHHRKLTIPFISQHITHPKGTGLNL